MLDSDAGVRSRVVCYLGIQAGEISGLMMG